MVDYRYVRTGLVGLARARLAGNMAGHLGAAVLAGYFFSEDHPELPEGVHRGVQDELDRIVRGEEAIWFDPKKAGVTIPEIFAPLPEAPATAPDDSPVGRPIAEALAGNIDQLRQSGHNVIFAAAALRALRDHPDHAAAAVVEGVARLIRNFDNEKPGRGYFGKDRGWIDGRNVELSEEVRPEPYADEQAMVNRVIDELIAAAASRRRGFGGLHHLVNHAAGLVELSLLGYRELSRRGLAAHVTHLGLWRSLPELSGELGPAEKTPLDPLGAEYWERGGFRRDTAMLTHRVKTLYGFFTLMRFVDDRGRRRKAEEALRYLVA